MGLFDKLLSRGAQVLGDAVSDAVSGKVSEVINGDSGISSTIRGMAGDAEASVNMSGRKTRDNWSFDKKMRQILADAGIVSVKTVVPVDDMCAELGYQLYELQRGCYKPDSFSYVVYRDERPVLLIRVWGDYNSYNKNCNRQVKENCKLTGVPLQDYFLYLPNEYSYMEERVGNGLCNM